MITVFGSVGMDLLFGLPHLPAIGGRVCLVGSAGADGFGAEVRWLLGAQGIDLTDLATVDAATCVASIWFDSQARNQIAVASGADLLTRTDGIRRLGGVQMAIPSFEVSKGSRSQGARRPRHAQSLAGSADRGGSPGQVVSDLNGPEATQLCTTRSGPDHRFGNGGSHVWV